MIAGMHAKSIAAIIAMVLFFCPISTAALPSAVASSASYIVVGTAQSECYGNYAAIPCSKPGDAFFGQDAQYGRNGPSYTLSSDGLTVYDNDTGLTWQRAADMSGGRLSTSDKLTWAQAEARPALLNAVHYGGYSDWRMPTIKELDSLILFNGTDVSPCMNTGACPNPVPFIDTNYFEFIYGNVTAGERIIDAQYWSSTVYVSTTMNGNPTAFGVNFADGRIKGYPMTGISPTGLHFTAFLLCVRGNPEYGKNLFVDNGDGTITDNATGLMWSKADSGSGMDWENSLAWVQTKNAENYLGHNDWRLPDAKELQSIVDYSRSPDTTGSAAINPIFTSTQITNEAGQPDYPYYWTSTTHASAGAPPAGMPGEAVYVAFGRAMGYMNGQWVDAHGAGAQRTDPKTGNPSGYPYGRGPEGDAVRIYNYIRLVRGGTAISTTTVIPESSPALVSTLVITAVVLSLATDVLGRQT